MGQRAPPCPWLRGSDGRAARWAHRARWRRSPSAYAGQQEPGPLAAKRPHTLTAHGVSWVDPYHWLADPERTDPAVLRHLQAENRHTQRCLAPSRPLQRLVRDALNAWNWRQLWAGPQPPPLPSLEPGSTGRAPAALCGPDFLADAPGGPPGPAAADTELRIPSPDGCCAAVLTCEAGAAAAQLCVRDAASGVLLAGPLAAAPSSARGAPALWVHSPAAAESPQRGGGWTLCWVAGEGMAVHCMRLPGQQPAAAAADEQAVAARQQGAVQVLHEEAAGAWCSLLPTPGAGDGGGLVASHAADGAALALWALLPGCGVRDDPAAPPPTLRRLQLPPGLDQHPADACARLVPSFVDGWLLVRYHGVSHPNGLLLACPWPAAAADGAPPPPSPPPWRLVLPHRASRRLEAVFAPPSRPPSPAAAPGPGAASAAQPAELAVLASVVDEGGLPVGLEAQLHAAGLGDAAAAPLGRSLEDGQAAEACGRLLAAAPVPLPGPFWQLLDAAWQPGARCLAVRHSSLAAEPAWATVQLQPPGEGRAGAPPVAGTPPGPQPPGAYAALQAWARAADGTRLPISLAYSTQLHGSCPPAAAPALLVPYGCYGLRESVGWRPAACLAMDAGFLVAVPHVRGGGWGGPAWQDGGRALRKRTAVADLVACAEHLVGSGLAAAGQLCLDGASAGAWLAASALLEAPGLWAAAVLTVPLLDPVAACLEGRLGGDEWGPLAGSPTTAAAARAWSPYDRLGRLEEEEREGGRGAAMLTGQHLLMSQHLLLRATLEDGEVGWWEAAKFAARLRALRTRRAAAGRAAGGLPGEGGGGGGGGAADPSLEEEGLLLLRLARGGHSAFEGDGREEGLKLAFLARAALAGGGAAAAAGGRAADMGGVLLERLQRSALVRAAAGGAADGWRHAQGGDE